jgi:hypothetical protein
MRTFARVHPKINPMAFVYALYQFLPVLPWLLKQGDYSTYLPYFPHQDTTYYLSLISSFLFGENGSPYYIDSEGAGTLSQVFPAIIGLGFKFVTTNVIMVWVLVVFMSSYFSYVMVTSIIQNLIKTEGSSLRKFLDQAAVAFFFFAIIGTQFQRVSPTQTGFLLFLFVINLILKKSRTFQLLKWIPPVIALGVINPFYGGVAGLTIVSLFARTLPIPRAKRTFLFLIAGGVLVIASNWIQVPSGDLVKRLDFTVSHLPGAIWSSALLLVLLFTLSISWVGARKDVLEYQFLKYFTFAILFLLNQQILTGLTWEPESHLKLVIDLQLLLIFLSTLRKCVAKDKSIIVIVGILAVGMTFFSIVEIAKLSGEARTKMKLTESQGKILREISKDTYDDQVIVFKKSSFSQNQIATLGLVTKVKFYWHPNSVFLPVSTSELSQRYACIVENIDEFNYSQESNLFLSHTYLNNLAFHRKYSGLLESEMRTMDAIIRKQKKDRVELTRVINFEISKCLKNEFSYEADYIVTQNLEGKLKIEKILKPSGAR